ncbi:MAG: alpha/beta hydrolase [Bacteroidota bacterium]
MNEITQQHRVTVHISAQYYTLNELNDQTKRIWVVFHGYGQLAKFFIRKFDGLDPCQNFIIAPQGLSKYYLEGVNGRVGASWMTKEDRLTEIENQYAYVDQILRNYQLEDKELVYFGFSQGTATMGRYAAHAKLSFSKMIIWAGTFPPDTETNEWSFLIGNEEILYYVSRKDPYFQKEMIDQQNKVISKATGKMPVLRWYEGGHSVSSDIVAGL